MIATYIAQGFKKLGFKVAAEGKAWSVATDNNEHIVLKTTHKENIIYINIEIDGVLVRESQYSKKQTTLQDVITDIDNYLEKVNNELDAYEHTCRNNWDR